MFVLNVGLELPVRRKLTAAFLAHEGTLSCVNSLEKGSGDNRLYKYKSFGIYGVDGSLDNCQSLLLHAFEFIPKTLTKFRILIAKRPAHLVNPKLCFSEETPIAFMAHVTSNSRMNLPMCG